MKVNLATSAELHSALKTAGGNNRQRIINELQRRWDETTIREVKVFRFGQAMKEAIARFDYSLYFARP